MIHVRVYCSLFAITSTKLKRDSANGCRNHRSVTHLCCRHKKRTKHMLKRELNSFFFCMLFNFLHAVYFLCFSFSLPTLFSFSFEFFLSGALSEMSNGLNPDHDQDSVFADQVPNYL